MDVCKLTSVLNDSEKAYKLDNNGILITLFANTQPEIYENNKIGLISISTKISYGAARKSCSKQAKLAN